MQTDKPLPSAFLQGRLKLRVEFRPIQAVNLLIVTALRSVALLSRLSLNALSGVQIDALCLKKNSTRRPSR